MAAAEPDAQEKQVANQEVVAKASNKSVALKSQRSQREKEKRSQRQSDRLAGVKSHRSSARGRAGIIDPKAAAAKDDF